MSAEAFNYYLNHLDIADMAPDVFYDFTSYSTDGSNEFINSVESGNNTYSGQITNNPNSFTGNVSGAGYFTNQHIKISEGESLYSERATILFSQQKSGRDNGTIFSNLSGESGYEVGINQANKLYFNHYVNGIPSIKTFNCVPAEKNIYALQLGGGTVALHRLNPLDEEGGLYNFKSQVFDIPPYGITATPEWTVGSGEYQYGGWIDQFLYFKQEINEEKLEYLAASLYQTYSINDPITGATLAPFTGVSVEVSGVTGVLGYSGHVTGSFINTTGYSYSSATPVTGAVGISGSIYIPITGILNKAYSGSGYAWMHDTVYQKIENIDRVLGTGGLEINPRTGFLSSGSTEMGDWFFHDNTGSYNGAVGSGEAGTLFGITGFSFTDINVSVTGASGNLLGWSGISGDVYSGATIEALYGPSGTYTGTGAREQVSGELPSGYFYDYLSNIADDGTSGFFEKILLEDNTPINRNGSILLLHDENKFFVSTTGNRSISGTNLFINGVAQLSGSGIQERNEFNAPLYKSSHDYFISGLTRLVPSYNMNETADAVYDYNQTGERDGILVIDDTAQYTSAPFSEIENISTKQIFLNGVKLYSGINYVDDGGFYPSGSVTEMTGVYFAYPAYHGAQVVTGEGESLFEVTDTPFKSQSYIMYLNGIRYPIDNFVEHAGDVDLITGKIIIDNNLTGIYYDYREYVKDYYG